MRGWWGACAVCCLLYTPAVFSGQQLGEQSSYAREMGLDQQFTYVSAGNGTGQMEYQGFSQPGKLTSASTWQIRKFTYDSSNRISSINWANGSDEFAFIWDNRSSYTYTN